MVFMGGTVKSYSRLNSLNSLRDIALEVVHSLIKVWSYLCFSTPLFYQFIKILSLVLSMLKALMRRRTDTLVCLRCHMLISSVLIAINDFFGITILLFISTAVTHCLIVIYVANWKNQSWVFIFPSLLKITSMSTFCFLTMRQVRILI